MRTKRTAVAAAMLLTVSCGVDDPVFPDVSQAVGDAVAFGIWTPGPGDTCSAAIHDSYATLGPDGIRYPTWHPPVDPTTGCTFGHEHGRDPSGSDLYRDVGPIPFGYANQHLEEGGFGAPRNEDHVGHKVEWENDIVMSIDDEGASAAFHITCDVLAKLHQGTHSADAFTNNMHEVVYHIRCTDRTGFSITVLSPIGTAGELVSGCDRDRHIPVGTANPAISPDGGGKRAIPDSPCVEESILNPSDGRPRFDSALRESWEMSVSVRTAGGRTLASINPYFQVMDPSRFFDAAAGVSRPIDLCYVAEVQGRDRCEGVSPTDTISWDDPRSPFKGVRRFVDVNANRVRNSDGPTVWYTDALGRNGSPEPFPGSIRQWIAQYDNALYDLHGPAIGRGRSYDAPGVHAPN